MKKTNVEKLKTLGILGDIRERLGAKDENDESKDASINKMGSRELVGAWAGWNLGDELWGKFAIDYYLALEKKQ